jgi:methionine biosynthesis protein MetW
MSVSNSGEGQRVIASESNAEPAYWTLVEIDRLKAVNKVLGDRKFDRMLDIGCGRGEFTVGVARERGVAEAYGVDFSKEGILAARRRGITATQVDLNRDRLPFSNGEFDLAIMIEAIEHLEDVEHCLQEVARVVRPRGSLVVTTPNLASWHGRLSLLLGFQPFTLDVGYRRHYGSIVSFSGLSSSHVRGFTPPALREILEMFQFKIESLASSPVPIPGTFRGKAVLSWVDRVLSKFPRIGSDLVVGCSRGSHMSKED